MGGFCVRKDKTVNNDDLQKLGDAIEESLRSYSCNYSRAQDGDGLGLADLLTAPLEQDVSTGLEEIRLLTDHILTDVADALRRLNDDGWVAVEDGLPNGYGEFEVFRNGYHDFADYDPIEGSFDKRFVTHWKPKSAPPSKGSE